MITFISDYLHLHCGYSDKSLKEKVSCTYFDSVYISPDRRLKIIAIEYFIAPETMC
ncbi:hypothetical protein B4096_2776 [Heyndrickxia coagulans]|nr:hypothetical protein B4096_2776 [Heyndrickxia coagulans]